MKSFRKRPAPVGFFECGTCSLQWYDFNVHKNDEQRCYTQNCGTMVKPFTVQYKCFGHFLCQRCNYNWKSNHAFAGVQEKCKKCGTQVPYDTGHGADGESFDYEPSNTEKKGAKFPFAAFFECKECVGRNRNAWNRWYDSDLGESIDAIQQDCLECWTMVRPCRVEDRCFGNFKCQKCNRHWFSAFAHADTYQQCKACKTEVHHHTISPLRGGGGRRRGDKMHKGKLCERCQKKEKISRKILGEVKDLTTQLSELKI